MNVYLPTSNMPSNMRSIQRNYERCLICESFIIDWLRVPPAPTDFFYNHLHFKRLLRVSSEITYELYRIVKRITPIMEYMMVRKIDYHTRRIKKAVITGDLPEECIPEFIFKSISYLAYYSTFYETDLKTDIDYIMTRLEEECIIQECLCEWMGYCCQFLMTVLSNIHLEHTGRKSASYAGPPLGMAVSKSNPPTHSVVELFVLVEEDNSNSNTVGCLI